MKRHTFATLAISLLVVTPLAGQQLPPEPGPPRPFNLPEVREFSLENGLDVRLIPYGEVPKATVRLVVATGTVEEGPDEIWLANLTGDLMQEGTTSRSAEQIAREAAGMGGAVSVNVGANQTSIGGEVLGEFAPDMVELIADIVRNPAFPASELPRLQENRVRQLAISRSQPQPLAQERFRALLYPDHPYGRLFPTAEMIQGYTVEGIRAFHGENFGAARSILYVAGRFDESALEQEIRAAFGDWAAGAAANIPVPQPQSERAVHIVDRPGAVQSTILMGLPVIDPSHPDFVALEVTNMLLGGAFGSRITTNIREDKGYTYSPQSTLSSRYRDTFWAQVADVTTEVTGPSLREIFYEIDRLRAEPPSEEELRGIQNFMSGLFVLRNSSRSSLIDQLSFLELHGLGREYLESYVDRIRALTPADITRTAQQYLRPEEITIVVVGDRGVIEEQVAEYGELR